MTEGGGPFLHAKLRVEWKKYNSSLPLVAATASTRSVFSCFPCFPWQIRDTQASPPRNCTWLSAGPVLVGVVLVVEGWCNFLKRETQREREREEEEEEHKRGKLIDLVAERVNWEWWRWWTSWRAGESAWFSVLFYVCVKKILVLFYVRTRKSSC